MEDKYLPIGTVCTLKGKNKKVMITGFYAVEFNGNLKINDYSGCAYPEGLLLPELNCTFNHSDIENVDFLGYRNEEQVKFLNLLNELTGNVGPQSNEWVLASNETYSKLLFDENGVVVLAEPVLASKKEDKVDVSNNLEQDDKYDYNPFYKEYELEEEPEEIVSYDDILNTDIDEIKIDEADVNLLNKIEFDEFGEIVSNSKPQTSKFSKYKFDENGVLIEILEETPKETDEFTELSMYDDLEMENN